MVSTFLPTKSYTSIIHFFNLYIRFLFSPTGIISSIFDRITRVLSALNSIMMASSLALASLLNAKYLRIFSLCISVFDVCFLSFVFIVCFLSFVLYSSINPFYYKHRDSWIIYCDIIIQNFYAISMAFSIAFFIGIVSTSTQPYRINIYLYLIAIYF